MYLNILLKRKKEPTHHFSFSSSTAIKTDKDHIHKGLKDHKGLTYSFNGPTKVTNDNKLVYRGFNKHYEGSHFNHKTDDTEYLKNFNRNPKTQSVELYTEYKNKYPKLSDNDYSIQRWQTEAGTPNLLNKYMRQDETGRSLTQIDADDKEFSNGLQKVEENIRQRRNDITKDYMLTTEDKKKELSELDGSQKFMKRAIKKYVNPVTIKPAIKKDEVYKAEDENFDKAFKRQAEDFDVAVKYFTKKVNNKVQSQLHKQKFKDTINEIKEGHNNLRKPQRPPMTQNAPSAPDNNLPDLPDDDNDDENFVKEYERKLKAAKQIQDTIIKKAAKKKAEKKAEKEIRLKQFEDDLNEAKSKIEEKAKEKKRQKIIEGRKDLIKQVQEQNKETIAHEKKAEVIIDEIIDDLENLNSVYLTNDKSKDVNKKLKEVDGSNIGAIKKVSTAIKILKKKKADIDKSKAIIQEKKKEIEKEKNAPRRVSRNLNIIDVSKLPQNDDESDYSVKKINKSKTTPIKTPSKK